MVIQVLRLGYVRGNINQALAMDLGKFRQLPVFLLARDIGV